MEYYPIVIIGTFFVLVFISLKVLLFDLLGVTFVSQGTYIAHTLRVNLGYATYQGFADAQAGVDTWLGIRYAAAPTGHFRWTAPREPLINNTAIIHARDSPPQCSQAGKSPYPSGATGDEDCLFLNVYSPPNARNLPVMVWIHGGGYGEGNAGEFPLPLLSFRKDFVGVSIQYRLGAFGFLASAEVRANGSINAGLLDQNFALQWVQRHIRLFGGDPENVTVAGQSAGAGSVLFHSIAYGGTLGSSIFTNLIAASPYIPTQYNYSDTIPSELFNQLAIEANCLNDSVARDQTSILDCLRSTDISTLQQANAIVSASGPYGTWTFIPVIDDEFITGQIGEQLKLQNINGERLLTSNMANEGSLFMPQNLTTEFALTDFLSILYPQQLDITSLLNPYHLDTANNTPATLYATDGTSTSPDSSTLLASSFATSYQQIANNIYAELTFICPSYWLADAFSPSTSTNHHSRDRRPTTAYRYQYSIPAAPHNYDLVPLNSGPQGYPSAGLGPDSARAILMAWTNFITTGDPSIPEQVLVGEHNAKPTKNETWRWPAWNTSEGEEEGQNGMGKKMMVNWNQTGGEEYDVYYLPLADGKPVTQNRGEGLRNAIDIVDGHTWEMGRGERCEALRKLTLGL